MTFQNNNENYSSMVLQTIPNDRRVFIHNKNTNLDVSDIEGARPRFIQKPRHTRQVFNNRNDDIEKSHCAVIIPKTVNKPDRQLLIDDIKGTRTQVNKFSSTRHTNPLNPAYQLPHCIYAPYPQVKFIKDNMQIDDIQGTRSKQTFAIKLQREGKFIQKDKMPQKKQKFIPKKDNFLFNVKDINQPQKKQKNNRCTNPLQPVYKIATSKQTDFNQVGFIEGSKASPQKHRKNLIDFNLNVQDIKGAVSNPPKKFISSKTEAIPQAQVGSYKRGISSNRKTNPLQPQYSYIGGSENKNHSFSRPKTAAQRLDAFLGK